MADSPPHTLPPDLKERLEAFAERAHLPWDLRKELANLVQEARTSASPSPGGHQEFPTEPIKVLPPNLEADSGKNQCLYHDLAGDLDETEAHSLEERTHHSEPSKRPAPPPVFTTHATESDSGDGGAPTVRRGGPTPAPILPLRYEDRGIIGIGGMGEVRRVFDMSLQRKVAMKLLLPHLVDSPRLRARFLEEAQVSAQLQHPGMVSVHDVGQLDDGRVYFTMQEVSGRTFKDIVVALHKNIRGVHWQPTDDGWTFRRLIDTLRRVCEAVAYAHARGVVHRDLKPSNIMVGAFGEVLVMDWGVAKVLGEVPETTEGLPQLTDDIVELSIVQTSRQRLGEELTRAGSNPGTLSYMAPEQALGLADDIGPAVDVYALGAILYAVLGGRPPFAGVNPRAIREAMTKGPPQKLEALLGPENLPLAPEPLRDLCRACLHTLPRARPANALEVAKAIEKWLEGEERRLRAISLLEEAAPLQGRITALRRRAEALEAQAEEVLKQVPDSADIKLKRPGWELEDRATQLRLSAAIQEAAYVEGVRGALAHDPDFPEAHGKLAEYYHAQHKEAEAAGDIPTAAQAEALLKAHDTVGHYKAYLTGRGALSLYTDPPGVNAYLYAYQEEERRLVPRFLQHLGETPILDLSLPRGSYLIKLRGPGLADVNYPVFIQRGERWRGIPPGETRPMAIPLPPADSLKPGEIYVPPGYAILGGDDEGYQPMPRARVWVEGFVISQFPLTNRAYLDYLEELLASGEREEAFARVPRERLGAKGEPGGMIYGFSEARGFFLRPDADGIQWLPDHPVVNVDWHDARAYAEHRAKVEGLPWRLPWEIEWEKAARGVDGRIFPWGRHLDPTWACVRPSHPGRPAPATVQQYPIDESPYGARGMAGNVMDWCLDTYGPLPAGLSDNKRFTPPEAPTPGAPELARIYRGGAWYAPASVARLANRPEDPGTWRGGNLGFRLVRSLSGKIS